MFLFSILSECFFIWFRIFENSDFFFFWRYFYVASFGPYLWKRNVIALSFAPTDNHEAEVQVLVLTYGRDMAHCSRCLIPCGSNDGKYMMEIHRVLKPGTRKWNRVRVLEVEVIRWRLLNNFMMRLRNIWRMVNKWNRHENCYKRMNGIIDSRKCNGYKYKDLQLEILGVKCFWRMQRRYSKHIVRI